MQNSFKKMPICLGNYFKTFYFFSLHNWHIVEIEATGPTVHGNTFSVTTKRMNPADPSAVTGTATYKSFLSSLLKAKDQGPGVHLC